MSKPGLFAYISRSIELASEHSGPKFERDHFHEFANFEFISPASAANQYGFLRYFPFNLLRLWLPAIFVALQRKRFSGLLASGEDVGLPAVILLRIIFGSKIPIIIVFHGPNCSDLSFKIKMAFIKNCTDVTFACLSNSFTSLISNRYRKYKPNFANFGYAVDENFFIPKIAPNGTDILCAGASMRDYQTLFSAVADTEYKVTLAPNSTWFPKEITFDPERFPNIEVRHLSSYHELRSVYESAPVVVVALLPADFPCGYAVIAEALCMGKAVIATCATTPPDFLVHGLTGLILEPLNPTALRTTIQILMANDALRITLGTNGAMHMRAQNALRDYASRLVRHLLG